MLLAELTTKALGDGSSQEALEASKIYSEFAVFNDKLKELREKVVFNVWEKVDEEHTAIRFVTSWATTKEQVSQLLSYL